MQKKSTKVNRKKTAKPAWNDTISNIDSFKSTAEDIMQRKLDHISKNQHIYHINGSSSKAESVYDRLSKIRYGNKMKENYDNNYIQRTKLVSSLFTSEKELLNLFEQSEKALSTVESMYGDPLKRYKVNPVITLAPDFNGFHKKSDTNNNNCIALNECSDSENDTSKSELKSTYHSQDKEDDLSKFRNFIENERKNEESHNDLHNKNPISVIGSARTIDASTETCSIDELNEILLYIQSRLINSAIPELNISNANRDITEKIVNHLLNLNKKNAIKIDLLNTELNKNKELIDALTLELINNSEQMKRLKNEFEDFKKNVSLEVSEMKSLFIKYLDRHISTNDSSQPLQNKITPTSATHYSKDKNEKVFNQQLHSLQLEHLNAQKRLENLMKIQGSIYQISDEK